MLPTMICSFLPPYFQSSFHGGSTSMMSLAARVLHLLLYRKEKNKKQISRDCSRLLTTLLELLYLLQSSISSPFFTFLPVMHLKRAMETCQAQDVQQPKCLPNRLENIEEDEYPAGLIPASLKPPETPTETMEFLARSWSLSATDLSAALGNILPPAHVGDQHNKQLVVSLGSSTPISSRENESLKFLRGASRAKTMAGWLNDHKQRRRVEARTRSAQIYAATSVAGVAAVVAASAAGSVFATESLIDKSNGTCKISAAIGSAAALVASHCVDMAQAIGATREQILAVIHSAVNAQTADDIMALTAGAATALRAAAILSARLQKENKEPEGCLSAQAFVSRGGELLKRTRKGDLHWKQVCVYINSNWKVVLKMKSTHLARSFEKKKKGAVVEVCSDIPAWPGREVDGRNLKAYFGIRTPERLFEFECRNKYEKQLWVDGIQQTLKFRAINMNTIMSM